MAPFARCPGAPRRSPSTRRWVSCATCKRPFTEPVAGVRKGYRTTERYRRRILGACERFSDLKAVRQAYRCSSALIHRVLYEQLELRRRMYQYPWPTKIGIDEHLFKHEPKLNLRRFVTMIVDHKNKRLMEVVHGKGAEELRAALDYIPGRENVQWVALDMSDSYRSFARDFFPNARLVADEFHVLRLVTPAIHRYLKALGLPREALPMYRVLRRNPLKLPYDWRWRLRTWLAARCVPSCYRSWHPSTPARHDSFRTNSMSLTGYVQAIAQRLQDTVALYVAVGGGSPSPFHRACRSLLLDHHSEFRPPSFVGPS